MTGPLCDLAIGLSASLANWAPPMTCCHHVPMRSPALTLMTVCDLDPDWPQIMLALVTSCTGLLLLGARRPVREPWSAPLTETFCGSC